jgi:type III secretion system FlhB-like substrate exporter
VVITNPTHYAVAIKYDPEVADAPLVLAKGADYLAAKIKEVAKENSIASRLETEELLKIEDDIIDVNFKEIEEENIVGIEEKKELPKSGLDGFKAAIDLFNDEV